MTANALAFYDSYIEQQGDANVNLSSDTFKVALTTSTYTPSASTHDFFNDITNELPTAVGYTAGGDTLASVTWSQTGGTGTFDAADTVWTASGGSIVARYAIVYKDTGTPATSPLIGYILMDNAPADITATDGNTLTLQWNGSGIFTFAKA